MLTIVNDPLTSQTSLNSCGLSEMPVARHACVEVAVGCTEYRRGWLNTEQVRANWFDNLSLRITMSKKTGISGRHVNITTPSAEMRSDTEWWAAIQNMCHLNRYTQTALGFLWATGYVNWRWSRSKYLKFNLFSYHDFVLQLDEYIYDIVFPNCNCLPFDAQALHASTGCHAKMKPEWLRFRHLITFGYICVHEFLYGKWAKTK